MILLPLFVTILYTSVNAFFANHRTFCIQERTEPNMIQLRENNILLFDTSQRFASVIQTKSSHFLKLIRSQSILPTAALCFTGGWLKTHSFQELIKIREFWISMMNTILIMSSSMIINDIFDRDIDKINHPHRPLVNGDVNILEAGLYTCLMLGISKISSISYLPTNLQRILDISYGIIFLYTPIFKKIPIVKNLICSGLIAFSIFFSGLSIGKNIIPPKMDILFVSTSFIFLGSLYNELLLDMRDIEGDRENEIYTIPVLIGNRKSWFLANGIVYINMFINTLIIQNIYKSYTNIILPLLFTPILYHLYEIKIHKFSKEAITNALKNTNGPLFGILIYLCSICSKI
jgi:geranylgeranylglycerol-phosphate geranylgeranyltransferase